MRRIQVMSPSLKGNEKAYVDSVIDSSWVGSSGVYLDRFEEEWARVCGTSHAISMANGTVSLHLGILALGAGPGDEVIVPAMTYAATANAVRYVGAEPVFVDIDPTTWCIDPLRLESAITRRTKGIVAVHLFGHPADMDSICSIANLYRLWVLEDAAQGHFSRYKDRPVGSLGDMASFSFHVGKIITCGEGGALTLSNEKLAKWICMMRGHGMDPDRRFFHPVTGFNYRLTNLQCSLLCAQLERHEEILSRRSRNFKRYEVRLRKVSGIGFQPVAQWARKSPWVFCVTVDKASFGRSRNELIAVLQEHGVESRPFYTPLHKLPPFREQSERRSEVLPNSDHLSEVGMYLPSGTDLSDEDIDYVCSVVESAQSSAL